MWAKLLQENLEAALGIVSPAVSKQGTLQQSLDVLLQEDNGRLKLTCTDLEIAANTWIDGQIEKPGGVSVPAHILDDFVKALPGGEVILNLTDTPLGMNVECQNYRSQINGHSAKDFPPVPTIEKGAPSFGLNPSEFGSILKRILPAVSKERSRPVLTGVKLDLSEDGYTMAAADGYRLAVDKGALGKPIETPTGMIIPGATLRHIDRLLGKKIESVEFATAGGLKQALFRIHDAEIVTALLDGNFPDYQKLLPSSWKTRLVAPLDKLQQALRVASVFVREGTGIVRLITELKDGRGVLTVAAQSDDIGETQSEIDVKLEGEATKIAFNHNFLNDMINAFGDAEEVVLETTSSSSPGLFTSPSLPNYKHVIMPMFVQW